jgi:hypothetical protein
MLGEQAPPKSFAIRFPWGKTLWEADQMWEEESIADRCAKQPNSPAKVQLYIPD